MSPKPTDIVPIKLRMREALRRKLEREAEKKKISANAEAIQRLEWSFEEEEERAKQEKWLKEQQEGIAEEERQFWEERAKQDAEDKAAFRDSEILRALVGGDENAELLRLFMLGLANNPNWAAVPESRKALADKIHNFLLTTISLNRGT